MKKDRLITFLLSITEGGNQKGKTRYIEKRYSDAIIKDPLCCRKDELSVQELFLISLAIEVAREPEFLEYDDYELASTFEDRVAYRLSCLFQDFNWTMFSELSCENYEKNSAESLNLALSFKKKHYLVSFDKQHQYDFKIENIHGIRKLLEMLNEDTCLVVERVFENEHRYIVSGICAEKDVEDCINFKIVSPGEWACLVPSKGKMEMLVKYKNGKPKISPLFELQEIKELLELYDIRDKVGQQSFDLIAEIICKMVRLNKGGILIFVNNMDRFEKLRATNRVFLSNKTDVGILELLDYASKIDGAVICDFTGKCLGYGAILDGDAYKPADLQRGSRYNSTDNFVYISKETFGIVVSDDGMIDVVCYN